MNYYVNKRIRPALAYYGGKTVLCRRILEMAPQHTTYVEPFAGALNVLLNKYRSDVEVACDLSSELILFYHVLVDHCEEIIEKIQEIKFEKESFLAAQRVDIQKDDLTRAVNLLCRQHMSYSGVGTAWATSPEKRGRWPNLPYDLRAAAKRLRGVKIVLGSAFDIISEYDSPETFFYCDPPYYGATRLSTGQYFHELNGMEHLRLLRMLNSLQGNVILSGYDHMTYNKELANWDRVEIDTAALSGLRKGDEKRTRRVEVLWVKT